MSDFLSRLIERTLIPPKGIRPQIAPLFAGALQDSVAEPGGEDVPQPLLTIDNTRNVRSPASKFERSNADAQDRTRRQASRPPENKPSERSALPVKAPVPAVPDTIDNDAEPLTTQQRDSDALSPPSQTRHTQVEQYRPLIPSVTTMAEDAESERATRTREAAQVTAEGLRVVRSGQEAQVTRQRHEPDASPALKVTIGRVEVRAVLPPATAPAPVPRPAPQLTLDEYIKQRKQGLR